MNIHTRRTRVFDFIVGEPPVALKRIDGFHRVGYFIHLQHPIHGNQWIYTECDAFGPHVRHPRDGLDAYSGDVHNVTVCINGVTSQHHKAHMFVTSTDYIPDTGIALQYGHYGAMQCRVDGNIMWAFNGSSDLGIMNAPSGFADWTFHGNAASYTVKRMCIFAIDLTFNDPSPLGGGYAHGDSPMWNARRRAWTAPRIPFALDIAPNEPNFIIVVTGQSNSQGYNAFFDETREEDQPNDRIMGFNSETNTWERADMRTESLGSFWHRQAGSQNLAFHFAKRLIETDEDIRPGIINLGVAGQMIARWAMYPSGHPFHDVNTLRANGNQGDIFLMHTERIARALSHTKKKTIDVVCWHQGESDMDATYEYYRESIYRVIDQYRSLDACNATTPFLVGETTGHRFGDSTWWVKQNNVLLGVENDGDPYTRCVHSRDLDTNAPHDTIHFSAEGQRHMGNAYYRSYREVIRMHET